MAAAYLTFDDGPDPAWTPAVAQALGRAGVRATFFVVGERAADHPDLVRDLLAAGHEVELHCMHHVRHTGGSAEAIDADMRDGAVLLRELGRRRAATARPAAPPGPRPRASPPRRR